MKILNNNGSEIKTEVNSKEEQLSKLFKYSTKALSDFEKETEEMMQMLHTTRDDQVSIATAYLLALTLCCHCRIKPGIKPN